MFSNSVVNLVDLTYIKLFEVLKVSSIVQRRCQGIYSNIWIQFTQLRYTDHCPGNRNNGFNILQYSLIHSIDTNLLFFTVSQRVYSLIVNNARRPYTRQTQGDHNSLPSTLFSGEIKNQVHILLVLYALKKYLLIKSLEKLTTIQICTFSIIFMFCLLF